MTAHYCYLCGKKWTQKDGEPPEIYCPACRPKPQRDLARLKEVVDA